MSTKSSAQRIAALLAGYALSAGMITNAISAPADKPFTIGNYPVEATATTAVAAKEKALADGQQAAFRALLKRLVPVTSYKRLDRLTIVKAEMLVDGVSVKSERNSSTKYIASLDFAFQPKAVRELLRREGVPFVDLAAPTVIVVPVYQASPAAQGSAPAALAQAAGQKVWTDAWAGLDLEHALAPVKLQALKSGLHRDTLQMMTMDGDGGGLRVATAEYSAELVLIALAEPDLGSRKLNVTLMGRDAVGQFALKRSYKFQADDFAYSTELAALVALGTLEGRWKALKARPSVGGGLAGSNPLMPVQMTIEFRSLQELQALRRQVTETPGVEDLQFGGQSSRMADVALRFPGGGTQLADSLASQGLDMRDSGGTWVLRAGR